MANTKKKDTTKTASQIEDAEIKEIVIESTTAQTKPTASKIQKENEELKSKIADMEEKMALLMEKLALGVTDSQTIKKEKNITFVNMTRGSVVLHGSQMWTIDKQFQTRVFSEREARIIVSNMGNFIRSGKVYITDAEFVEENDLLESYKFILSDNDLKALLDKEPSYVIDTYKMVADGQKKIIVDMVVDRKKNGIEIDANILDKLGKLCGRELISIEPSE